MEMRCSNPNTPSVIFAPIQDTTTWYCDSVWYEQWFVDYLLSQRYINILKTLRIASFASKNMFIFVFFKVFSNILPRRQQEHAWKHRQRRQCYEFLWGLVLCFRLGDSASLQRQANFMTALQSAVGKLGHWNRFRISEVWTMSPKNSLDWCVMNFPIQDCQFRGYDIVVPPLTSDVQSRQCGPRCSLILGRASGNDSFRDEKLPFWIGNLTDLQMALLAKLISRGYSHGISICTITCRAVSKKKHKIGGVVWIDWPWHAGATCDGSNLWCSCGWNYGACDSVTFSGGMLDDV